MNVPSHSFAQTFKLTVADLEVLHDAGAFDGTNHIELIDGVLLRMNPQRRPHGYAGTELGVRLSICVRGLDTELGVLIDCTIAMPPHNAPEPDIFIASDVRGQGYASLETVRLAVEVGDSSLSYDVREKAALYARHGVPEYWVVAIPEKQIHQFWSPASGEYRERRAIRIGERIASVTVPGLEVETEGLV